MQIKDPEPLLQHLEKTAEKIGSFACWYISERLTLMVDNISGNVEYCLSCEAREEEPFNTFQDLSRDAALHWLREAV